MKQDEIDCWLLSAWEAFIAGEEIYCFYFHTFADGARVHLWQKLEIGG